MKALIWKFRYAHFIRRQGGLRWRDAWHSANTALHDFDFADGCPIDAAREEMSYWEAA